MDSWLYMLTIHFFNDGFQYFPAGIDRSNIQIIHIILISPSTLNLHLNLYINHRSSKSSYILPIYFNNMMSKSSHNRYLEDYNTAPLHIRMKIIIPLHCILEWSKEIKISNCFKWKDDGSWSLMKKDWKTLSFLGNPNCI